MPALTVTDLNNAKTDVDHIADLANSPAPTATDRNGVVKMTWSGLLADLNSSAAITQTGLNRTGAEVAKAAAETARTGAESARDAAIIGSGVFTTEPLGRAAVADGAAFKVQGSGAVAAFEYRRVNAGTVSTLIATYPSSAAVDDIYSERLFAAQARWRAEKRTRSQNTQRPRALVLIALGQSNNANFNTNLSTVVSVNAFQPSGGNAIGFWDFYAANQEHAVQWDDIGLAPVQWADATTENALTGAITVLDGVFPRIYAFSAAYGGNAILQLGGAGKRTNLYAAVHKLCDHARAAGFEPVVAYTSVQGEANMSSFGLLTEAAYYTAALGYYRMCQMLAAQAMELPGYEAPIVFFTPVQAMNGDDSRGIKNAIIRVANDIPNGILAGGMYQWPVNADLIHGSSIGFRERSEYAGWLLQRFFTKGEVHRGLKVIDAARVGTTVTVTFNDEITRDTTTAYLNNATSAPAGIEYDDAGTNINLTIAAIAGRKATLTLATAPVGAANLQFVRIGSQNTASSGVWPGASSGSQIRSATEPGFLSLNDPTYRQFVWAAPQKFAVR